MFRSSIAVFLLLGGVVFCQELKLDGMDAGIEGRSTAAVPAKEHPLMPVIRWAEKERVNIAAVKDYTATMQKQECVNGVVQEVQIMEAKIRTAPLSVYLKFKYPRKMVGQEAIYVAGQNNGKLIGHGVGIEKHFGTMHLDPDGFVAMRGNKYPITEIGILNLVDKLLEVGRKDSKFAECEVTYTPDCKIGKKDAPRTCTMIQVTHPIPRPSTFIFHIARIYVDKELNMPIQYESYDWPKGGDAAPMLIEAYTYSDLKLNVGLKDADFDYKNPNYGYAK